MRTSVLAALAVLVLPSLAFAQAQSADQQACINTLNKGMNKIAGVQAKVVGGCVSDAAKGEISSAYNCYDFSAAVQTARVTACDAYTDKCTMLPSFGPNDCNASYNGAKTYVEKLAQDLFSFGPETITSCTSDAAKCKCQAKVWKATYKLLDARIKTFNLCKKNGLKNPDTPFTSASDIAGCLAVDPKLQIENTQVKLDVAIDKSCFGVASPFDVGSCPGLTGTPLRNCLDTRTRCRMCKMAVVADNLDSSICDMFDDAILNSSCSD